MGWTRASFALLLVLVIGASACSQVTGRSAATTVSDTEILAKVKTKLAAEQIGTLTRVDVDAVRGTVYLNGVVQNAAMKTRAGEVARQVDGVTEVVNNLQVSAAAR
jgi:osmotically-inducible protein OsmY